MPEKCVFAFLGNKVDECAALAACAKKRCGKFGQFLFTADSLANVHEYDVRDFGADSHEKALLLALDAILGWQ